MVVSLLIGGHLARDPRRHREAARGSPSRIAAGATAILMTVHLSVTDWFNHPGLGIVGVGVARRSGLGVARHRAHGGPAEPQVAVHRPHGRGASAMALYYPFMLISDVPHPLVGARPRASLAIVVGVVDRLPLRRQRSRQSRHAPVASRRSSPPASSSSTASCSSWPVYANSDIVNGRPIGTVGSGTPNLQDVHQQLLDLRTRLASPTCCCRPSR